MNNHKGPIILDNGVGTPVAPGGYFGFGETTPVSSPDSSGPRILSGVGTPNGVLVAPIGSLWLESATGVLYRNTDGVSAWSAVAGDGALTPALIQLQVLAAPAATVLFSAIPSTFTDLLLIVQARTDVAATVDTVLMTVNGDNAAASYRQQLNGAENGAALVTTTNTAIIGDITGNTALAASFGSVRVEIPAYSMAARIRQARGFSVNPSTAAIVAANFRGWARTAASVGVVTDVISSIQLAPGTGPNFATGSTFRLIGLP